MSDSLEELGHLRMPPNNTEAEEACLGSCLIDPEAFELVSAILAGSDDFYHTVNQEIYAAMMQLARDNDNIDVITVTNFLRDHNSLDKCGGAANLLRLSSVVASSAHVVSYAQIVSSKAVERRLQSAGSEIVRLAIEGEEDAANKVDVAESMIFAIGDSRNRNELVHVGSMLEQTFETLLERYQNNVTITGVSTGFTDLDAITSGFQPSDLIIIGARPSMGKTAFALAIALNVALNKEKPGVVAVFSLEMAREQLVQRVLCSIAKVNSQAVRTGRLQEQDWQRLSTASNELSPAALYIDDQSTTTVLEMKSKLRRLQKRVGLDIVIIDYLQLINSSLRSTAPREQQIAEISRMLKGLAKELKVPIVALSQLSRSVEGRQDKRPSLSDLRESGSIEQDADIVAFLYRDEYYNKQTETPNTVEVIIAKQRNGPVDTVKLFFDKNYGCFDDLSGGGDDYSFDSVAVSAPAPRRAAQAGFEQSAFEVPI